MNSFDLVIGYEDIKRELLCISDVLRNPEKYEKIGVDMPHGILLYGDHGMGKTFMAECFILECDFPVFEINKVEPGCEVTNEIRAAFAEAKKAEGMAIVFLDNLDDDADANTYAALKAYMDDCDSEEVFVLATAKDNDNIPDYLLRAGRFDKVLGLYYPTYDDTVKILNYYISQKESEMLRAKKDQLVATKMAEYYQKAKQILAEHRVFLDRVTEELMERKTLTQKDIKRIHAEIYS